MDEIDRERARRSGGGTIRFSSRRSATTSLMPRLPRFGWTDGDGVAVGPADGRRGDGGGDVAVERSEEHTSELQSLMRISYAVLCLQHTIASYNKQPKNKLHI